MPKSSAPPISSIRSVEAVTRLRSVTAAARELQISQPAVTQALSRLAEEFGSSLFLEGEDGLQATETALALSGMYRSVKNQFDQIKARAEARNDEGVFISISPALSRALSPYLLSKVAASFRIEQIASADDLGPLRRNQISIARRRGDYEAAEAPLEERSEHLQMVSFRGAITSDEISFADTIYVPHIWQDAWVAFNAAKQNEINARLAVVDDPATAYSLAKMGSALCLQDMNVLSVLNPYHKHYVVSGLGFETGWRFSVMAGSGFDPEEVRRVFCGWLSP